MMSNDEHLISQLSDICEFVETDTSIVKANTLDFWPFAMLRPAAFQRYPLPIAVVKPVNVSEVAAVLSLLNSVKVPVVVQGGRSGVCGGSIPAFGGVCMDLTAMKGIISLDESSCVVEVAAGTFGKDLEKQLRQEVGMTLGHWPQSIDISTVGGWLACRSSGQYSTRYGKIEDMARGLEVVLADGTILHTGNKAPRSAMGGDLTQLFVGSEGTLGVITKAELRTWHLPEKERRAAYLWPSFEEGLDACRRILQRHATPALLRLYDKTESSYHFSLSDRCILLVLDEGDPAIVDSTMKVVEEECSSAEVAEESFVARWLESRNDISAMAGWLEAEMMVDTIEIAARWSALPRIHRRVVSRLTSMDGVVSVSAHQSHAYSDGACIYYTIIGERDKGERDPERRDSQQGITTDDPTKLLPNQVLYIEVWDTVMHIVMEEQGAISHHHGIGLNRARFMRSALGEGLDVLARLKNSLDPQGILNPGKLGLPTSFGELEWPF